LKVWEYEKEVRVFTNGKQFVDVKVNEIILGSNMATRDIGFVKNLVSKIDKTIE